MIFRKKAKYNSFIGGARIGNSRLDAMNATWPFEN